MADLLNESQRRMLTSTLMLHEKDLRQADAWLQGIGVEGGILYHRTLRLSAEQRAAARQVIAQALEQITELARRFDLRPKEDNLVAAIRAQMQLDWCDLSEMYANALKSCGTVDPLLGPSLDPGIAELSRLAMTLEHLLTNEPRK